MEKKSRRIERNKILNDTLNQMDYQFSSNEFSKLAEINGITREEIINGVIAEFLKPRCERLNSNRFWVKRKSHKKETNDSKQITTVKKTDEEIINEAVELLKLFGYRILKPFSDWIEL